MNKAVVLGAVAGVAAVGLIAVFLFGPATPLPPSGGQDEAGAYRPGVPQPSTTSSPVGDEAGMHRPQVSITPTTLAATAPSTSPAPSAPPAGEWPVYRGDGGLLGVAPGSLPDALEIRWKYKTNDEVTSSPVVAGGRVFIGSKDANVFCLDLATGKKLWAFPTGDAVEAPPLVADGAVYVGSADTFLYALDAATGKLKWKHETQDKILGTANSFRDGPTGQLRIVVGSYDYNLYCLDPAEGKVLWKYQSGNYINSGVAVADGRSIFGGCDGMVHVVPPDGQNAKTIEGGTYIAATAFDGRRAYVGNQEGGFLCVDVQAGKIAWRFEGDSPFLSSPAVAGDRVVVGSADYRLYCLDRDTGKKLWAFTAKDEINSSPVVCGGRVVFGSNDGRLYIVNLADGKLLWSYELGQPVLSSPAVVGEWVIIGCSDKHVYAFGPKR